LPTLHAESLTFGLAYALPVIDRKDTVCAESASVEDASRGAFGWLAPADG
jgi:hypothetical protein